MSAFAFTSGSAAWLILALLQGGGAASASTVANLFIVEIHPKAEWDERLGWLQTFYGGGQVVGLLLAGLLSQTDPHVGLLVAAGLTTLAILPGWLTTRTALKPLFSKPLLLHAARHGEWPHVSPQRMFHRFSRQSLRQIGRILRSPFGLFLATWTLAFAGSAAIFSQYPVLMQRVFDIPPGTSSTAFALAAALGLALYSPAGPWSNRSGASRVL